VPVQRAPRGPVIVPDERGPRAARERTANPPAGTAPAPRSGVPREHVPCERDCAGSHEKRMGVNMNVTGHFGPASAGGNRVFMRVFESARTRSRRNEAEPQRGPVVKSRSGAHGAKCEKSLNGKVFGAASESFF
jgi:hypothetical protein